MPPAPRRLRQAKQWCQQVHQLIQRLGEEHAAGRRWGTVGDRAHTGPPGLPNAPLPTGSSSILSDVCACERLLGRAWFLGKVTTPPHPIPPHPLVPHFLLAASRLPCSRSWRQQTPCRRSCAREVHWWQLVHCHSLTSPLGSCVSQRHTCTMAATALTMRATVTTSAMRLGMWREGGARLCDSAGAGPRDFPVGLRLPLLLQMKQVRRLPSAQRLLLVRPAPCPPRNSVSVLCLDQRLRATSRGLCRSQEARAWAPGWACVARHM